jgi:hypothetical protein
MAKRLWMMQDGEPWMVNPALAVWNKPRRRKRRRISRKGGAAMARPRRRRRSRARARRNGPFTSTTFAPNRKRRRRARRNYYSVVTNRPRRRARRNPGRRRSRGFGQSGSVSINKLLPLVGAGVGAGLVLGYATPMIVTRLGIVPSGPVYRLVQAGIAVGGAMLGQRLKLVGGQAATAFAAYGATVAAIGLVNDLGLLSGLGIGSPAPVTAAAASPAGTAGVGYYENGSYTPYGQAGPQRGGMQGYYRLTN